MVNQIKRELRNLSEPERAKNLIRFFKTGKGEYGEGDRFLGITVPMQRQVAKKYYDISLKELKLLLSSKYHEHRLTSLLILVGKYAKADEKDKEKIAEFYLNNTTYVNNWDLVDTSADKIIGEHLRDKDRNVLYKLARSENLWERRISIMATFSFIRHDDYKDTLKITEILLSDEHDLIHKAAGWMLREIGKRNRAAEEVFLKRHYKRMPRTMLRYAIEKFDKDTRRSYLKNLL